MNWQEAFKAILKNPILHGLIILVLLVPLVGTIGQYWTTGFFTKEVPVLILFWPGVEWQWRINLPGWLITGIFFSTYLIGISYMYKSRTLSKVTFLGIGMMLTASFLGSVVTYFTGWQELQNRGTMQLAGKINLAILASWHNPLWEEIVFRGLPLLIVILIRRKLHHYTKIAKLSFLIIPSIAFAIYHVPNHGYYRIVDTFFAGLGFAWLTLRYSFYAPMVLHYLFDIMSVFSIGNMKGVPTNEVKWLIDNNGVLNTTFSLGLIGILTLIPILLVWYRWLRYLKPLGGLKYEK